MTLLRECIDVQHSFREIGALADARPLRGGVNWAMIVIGLAPGQMMFSAIRRRPMRLGTDQSFPWPRKMRVTAIAAAVLICLLAFLLFRQRSSPFSEVQAGATMNFSSTSFSNHAAIPSRYTCDGANTSPELDWSGAPDATKSFAIIMHDPDAPVDFTHWLAFNIPSSVHQLAEGASNDGAMPAGSAEGMNGFGRTGYGGPCPPHGKAHHYVLQLYALNADPGLPAGASREQLEAAMRSHIVASGRLTGTYQRGGE
jgi:Raf kinase inhibitor-like YbhB/YbcL family protein